MRVWISLVSPETRWYLCAFFVVQILQEAVENNPKLEPIIIIAVKEVLYSSSALVLKSKDENNDNMLRFQ